MNKDINLITNKNEAYEKRLNNLKLARIAAVISLAVVAILSIVIFILDSQVPLAAVRRQETDTINNISALQGKLAKLYLINDRVTNIQGIEKQRLNFNNVIKTVLGLVPSGMTVEEFNIDQSSILFSVSGRSLADINTFLNSFVDLGNKAKLIKSVSIQTVQTSVSDSTYQVTVSALPL